MNGEKKSVFGSSDRILFQIPSPSRGFAQDLKSAGPSYRRKPVSRLGWGDQIWILVFETVDFLANTPFETPPEEGGSSG